MIRILLTSVLSVLLFVNSSYIDSKKISETNMYNIILNDKYKNLWKIVIQKEKKGLYKEAKKTVDEIYSLAKKNNNYEQVIKALFHKIKYNISLSIDDGLEATIKELQEIAKTSKTPLKQIAHSIKAEAMLSYYKQNRWKIIDVVTSNYIDTNDINTWDMKTFSEEIAKEYMLSLSNYEELINIKLNQYKYILNYKENTNNIRPTLYDLLANKSLDFFKNTQFNLTKPADFFTLNNDNYFDYPENFIKIDINSKDSSSYLFYVLKIYQRLTEHSIKTQNKSAIIENTLSRLEFVRNQSTSILKDKLFIKALYKLVENFDNNEEIASVWYKIAEYYRDKGNEYDINSNKNRWDLTKSVNICNSMIEKYPKSFGAEKCRALKQKIEHKDIGFEIENIHSPQSAIKIIIKHKNVNKLYFKLVRNNFKKDKNIEEINKLKPIRTWTEDLNILEEDYQKHLSLTYTDGLPLGNYYIIAGTNKKFISNNGALAYCNFWVTNISFSKKNKNNKEIELTVVNSETGQAKPNVDVKNNRERYKTDNQGRVTIKTDNKYNNYYTFKDDKDEYSTIVNNSYNSYNNKDDKTITKTMFFTDRAIYKPGQTLFFKGIVLEEYNKEYSVVVDTEKTIYLHDANNNEITNINVKTNKFGTFSGSFLIPTGLLNGTMCIADDNYNIKTFKVEEYKRPKFEIIFDTIYDNYKLDDSVSIKGVAKAFAGYKLYNADVKYRVVRKAKFPYLCYYKWGYIPKSSSVEIKSGRIKTNEYGVFNIDFKTIEDYDIETKFNPIYSYEISVDITDINGETQSKATTINVGYKSIYFSIDIKNSFDKKEETNLYINTYNLNGYKINAKGAVKITKLIEPKNIYRPSIMSSPDVKKIDKNTHDSLFPYDSYNKENKIENLKKSNNVTKINFNTKDNNKIILKSNSLEAGRYVVEAEVLDKQGRKVMDRKYFTVFDKTADKIPTKEILWVKNMKTKLQPEDTAIILLGTAEDELIVHYDVINKDNIEYSGTLNIKKEQLSIEVPVKEEYRGGFNIVFYTTKHNRFIKETITIEVPYTNKKLDVTFETFRNKLEPGEKEEWKIKIRGPKGNKEMAELLATMYDASLDKFAKNNINLYLYRNNYIKDVVKNNMFIGLNARTIADKWNTYYKYPKREFTTLNTFGFRSKLYSNEFYIINQNMELGLYDEYLVTSTPYEFKKNIINSLKEKDNIETEEANTNNTQKHLEKFKVRTNFKETAFFFPHLQTDKHGNITIKFTMPESLTRWKLLALAHTKDLKIGTINKELITQKTIMVVPNTPRFFREGDKITFSSKVVNLSNNNQKIKVKLDLFDAESMTPINEKLKNYTNEKNITVEKNKSNLVSWDLEIPKKYKAIKYRIIAESDKHSDGEENTIPVLPNRMLVTETLPISVRNKGNTEFVFSKLTNQEKDSKSLENYKLTLEFSSNPIWYAIQSLPYLIEYPYECSEQLFSRFYGNSLALNIIKLNPKIKQVLDYWNEYNPNVFLSNLEKNQELKNIILEETPWVLNAKNEREQKKRISILFDIHRMQKENQKVITKLKKQQLKNGAWPWFSGMEEDLFITQHIIAGMGHLKKLGINKNNLKQNINRAIYYTDNQMFKKYQNNKEQKISNNIVQYLYARSFFLDKNIKDKNIKAYNYFLNKIKEQWNNFNLHTQGMIALICNRNKDFKTANAIITHIKEKALYSNEMGMYWAELNNNKKVSYWLNTPIETQSLLIEAFKEIKNDSKSVIEMKLWLLKQKQTSNWKTTKATTSACYALLLNEENTISKTEPPIIKLNNKKISIPKIEQGTGYIKTSWNKSEITPQMGKISIHKNNEKLAWGAMYLQYFENLDKVKSSNKSIETTKEMFIEKNTQTGKVLQKISDTSQIKIGDKIKVIIKLQTDRNLDYVHVKDTRAAGFEPINVISTNKWKYGISYYESTKDASTNFFINYVNKGTHILEYYMVASQKGTFSNGITTAKCMYAPEFYSNSKGMSIRIN